MDRAVEQLIDYLTAQYALEQLRAQLDAAGITDPAEREHARQLVVNYFKTQRAAVEAVGAVRH